MLFVFIYQSEKGLDELDKFYSDFLMKDGWERTARSDSLKTFIELKKGNYSIEIEFDKVAFEYGEKDYAVSCSYDLH